MWYTTEKCYTNVINENNLANCMLFGTIIAKFLYIINNNFTLITDVSVF